MYYFISNNGQLLECIQAGGEHIKQVAQEWADETGGDIYVIEGEHSGITASPKDEKSEGTEKLEDHVADLKKLEKWRLMSLRAKLL